MKKPGRTLAAVLIVAGGLWPGAGSAAWFPCGETGCAVAGGTYHIALPDSSRSTSSPDPVPALVFFHGYGGKAARLMDNGAMVQTVTERGYALIAPQGVKLPDRRATNWTVPNEAGGGSDSGRDDVAFLKQILADTEARFGIDGARRLAGGFSLGGMFVWHLACRHGGLFQAYAPIAGVIWAPAPEACTGAPVALFHTHGFRDKTVPLEGRPVGGGRLVQGDVFRALDVLRDTNDCPRDDPNGHENTGEMQCRFWNRCAGPEIRFCLHPGGHAIPIGWAAAVLDWFERLGSDPASPDRYLR
ncbi:MAG: alpha/beta hydrolase-fold protein [Alphaproteobacteria bacterium]|nr:alpha/beta hydrolase-fold protein [Alphaproteobacteria bacterium]